MTVDIRTIERHELGAWEASMRVGFHQPEPKPDEARARDEQFAGEMDWSRSFGAFDGGRVVATFRSFATELTVPGGSLVADAITNVTVAPTHRRRGILSTLMRDDLAAAAGRGEAVAILVASEWPIYGRYGFGPAVDIVEVEVDARAARFAVPGAGDVAMVTPEELREAAPAVYDAHRRATPGAIERSGPWWDRRLGLVAGFEAEPTRRYVLARDADGAPSGLLVYTVEGNWDAWRPNGTLTVEELFGVDAAATARLWRVAVEVDLVVRVVADQRGADDPLPLWLTDARAVRQRYRTDFQWVRVLDVPAALAAADWVREERPGALARADAMFGWLARPWCATLF
jgi:predicted acetyltransferase